MIILMCSKKWKNEVMVFIITCVTSVSVNITSVHNNITALS